MSDTRGTSVALVGLGRQGLKIAGGLREAGYRVVAGCDLRDEALQAFRRTLPDAAASSDLSAIQRAAPDVCVVATLADAHVDVIERLLGMGVRHVLCEKPVVNRASDLVRLATALTAPDVSMAVNHPRLWSDDHHRVRELVQREELGRLLSADARFKPKGFGNIGVHSIASVLFLTGRRLTSVVNATFDDATAVARGAGHADRNGVAHFMLEDVPFTASNRTAPIDGAARIALDFEAGRVDLLEASSTCRVLHYSTRRDAEETTGLTWSGSKKTDGSFVRFLDRAVQSVVAHDTGENLRCAMTAAEAVIAAQLSHQEQRHVTLPLPAAAATPYPFS